MKYIFKEVKPKSKYNVLVYDNIGGSYLAVALKLANHFNKVYYYADQSSPYPVIAADYVGFGYDTITKISDVDEMINEFDIIIFPDTYCSDKGYRFRKEGKMVFGGSQAEQLETNRHLFKQELTNAGLEIAPNKYFKGVSALSKYLSSNKDKWVKLSYFRGERESFHHINWHISGEIINEMKYSMGPLCEEIEFCVEDNINAIAEIGNDGWCVNGERPINTIWGLEVKDCGYIGKACTYDDLPNPIKLVTTRFTPIMKKYNHTGFYSTEIRYTKNNNIYYTDPCIRVGSPSGNVYLDMIDNWDEIIPAACKGVIVEPKYNSKYGVEIILKSSQCKDHYLPLTIPKENRKYVNLKGSFMEGGEEWVIPFGQCGFQMEEFGSVVVCGNDLEKIMEQAMEIAHSIQGIDVDYNKYSLMEAQKALQNVEDTLKIKF